MNLSRRGSSQVLRWRVPLEVLANSLDAIADFPFHKPGEIDYPGPTLFIRGTRSRYISDDTIPVIKKFFPNSRIVDVEAGHWLTAENPEAFVRGTSLAVLSGICLTLIL